MRHALGKRPPGPRQLPFVGNAIPFMRDRLGFLTDAAEYGPVVSLRLFGRPFYLITHPDLIQQGLMQHSRDTHKGDFVEQLRRLLGEGLVTSEDEFWRKQRKLVAYAFTPSRIRRYADHMVDAADQVVDQWSHNQSVNVHRAMAALTMDVIGRTLFGTDLANDSSGILDAWESINDYYVEVLESPLPLPRWWPSRRNLRFRQGVREIDTAIRNIIDERVAHAQDRGDLLSGLLLARDDEGGHMSTQQVRDECITMFIAGHETSGLALVHTLYLLAQHPEVEKRVRHELRRVLGNRRARYEDVAALKYTEQVVKEAMRVLPPVWALVRKLTRDIRLGGFPMPKGSTLLFSQWVTHRDPALFVEPSFFDPERWSSERIHSIPKFAYFPFGAGPRACIGNHFAMMELVLVIATILQRSRLTSIVGHDLRFDPSATLRAERDLYMRVEEAPPETSGLSRRPRTPIPRRRPPRRPSGGSQVAEVQSTSPAHGSARSSIPKE